MDSLIFELQIVFYFQLFLSANVRHMALKDRQLNSMAFQALKMKFLNSMTFQVFYDLCAPCGRWREAKRKRAGGLSLKSHLTLPLGIGYNCSITSVR